VARIAINPDFDTLPDPSAATQPGWWAESIERVQRDVAAYNRWAGPREAMTEEPFSDTPDATAADCEIRRRAFNRPEATCDVASKPRKKKVDLNPLQRRWFEASGYTFARVEHANAFGGMTVDLWGCWDYLAVHPDRAGVLFVQVTTLHNLGARLRKIQKAPETAVLLAAGNRAVIHAWHQPGGAGSKW
jgi:hypothetical protein